MIKRVLESAVAGMGIFRFKRDTVNPLMGARGAH